MEENARNNDLKTQNDRFGIHFANDKIMIDQMLQQLDSKETQRKQLEEELKSKDEQIKNLETEYQNLEFKYLENQTKNRLSCDAYRHLCSLLGNRKLEDILDEMDALKAEKEKLNGNIHELKSDLCTIEISFQELYDSKNELQVQVSK